MKKKSGPKGRRKKIILLRFCPKKIFWPGPKTQAPPPEYQMDRALPNTVSANTLSLSKKSLLFLFCFFERIGRFHSQKWKLNRNKTWNDRRVE